MPQGEGCTSCRSQEDGTSFVLASGTPRDLTPGSNGLIVFPDLAENPLGIRGRTTPKSPTTPCASCGATADQPGQRNGRSTPRTGGALIPVTDFAPRPLVMASGLRDSGLSSSAISVDDPPLVLTSDTRCRAKSRISLMIPGPNVPATQIRMLGGILVGGPTRPFFFSVGQDVDWFGASWGEMDEAVERAMEACKRQLEVAAIEILKKQGYDCGKCSMRAHAGDVLDFKCHLAVKLVGDGGCNSTAQGFLDRIPICVVICEEGIKEFEVICFCPGREVS